MRLTAARLAAVAAEANAALAGRTVRRVRERPPDSIEIETSGGSLLVSWHPSSARLHLTDGESPTIAAASPFPQKLRADVEGAVVGALASVPGDRVASVEFDRAEEDGSRVRRRLVLEAFGSRCNAFLLDDDGIVVAIARPRSARGREPGAPYAAPPAPPPAGDGAPGREEFTTDEEVSPSRSLEAEARAAEAAEEIESRRAGAARAARGAIQRLASRRSALERDLEDALHAPRYRLLGEMLRASFARIPKGATEVSLEDWNDPEARPIRIPLDPAVPPAENIRRYFQKAKKGAAGEPVIRKQIAAVGERLAALEAVAAEAAAADSAESLDAVEARLASLNVAVARASRDAGPGSGPLAPPSSPRARASERLPYRSFVSCDGFPILVGRGARENDQLTLRFARGNDLWLHVSGGPGAHVVIRVPTGKSVPLETLLDAAALAVQYSPRRGRSGVEVVYTPAKNVRKPRGAAPGLVTFAGGRNLKPNHDAERLRRLLGADETAP